MNLSAFPGKLGGILEAPPSKSSMQRACAAALLHQGTTLLSNIGNSSDELAALNIIRQLGARVTQPAPGTVMIQSDFRKFATQNTTDPLSLNCGESAFCARLFTPVAALCNRSVMLSGEGSLKNRNLHFPEDVYRKLNISTAGNLKHLPVTVTGPLQPQSLHIDAAESSQHLSGLLFAFAASVKEPTRITATSLNSKPYVDLSIEVLLKFGFHVEPSGETEYSIYPKQARENGTVNYTVEGDWSTAAFFLTGAAVSGSLTVTGLDVFSKQADRAVLQALMMTGVPLSITEKNIVVNAASSRQDLKPFQFDATQCPDLFPPLAILAACCNGTSVIEGIQRLQNKESNRASSITHMLERFGITATLQDNLMIIEGKPTLNITSIDSCNDHRIAMAAAIGALRAEGPVEIIDAQAVRKSFPDFFKELNRLNHLNDLKGNAVSNKN